MPELSGFKNESWDVLKMNGEVHHYEQVVGNSGVYIVVTDDAGNIIRDDRPWQMKEGVS